MNKEKLRKDAMKAIRKLTKGVIEIESMTTCNIMKRYSYIYFLIDSGIISCEAYSIYFEHFKDGRVHENQIQATNIFRMMVITEYCKQNGVKL
jgi:predicted nucleic acid-binding protein